MTVPAQKKTQKPLIVMCAPNGARLQKSDHAMVPLTPGELTDCAASLLPPGVSIVHLHVRDSSGRHSLDPGLYRQAMAAIRERVGDRLILQVTTEALGMYDRQQQMDLVRELRPEAVSLAFRELCPDERSLDESGLFFRELASLGTWPQYILYTREEAARFDHLRKAGYFGTGSPFALIVLGRHPESEEGSAAGLNRFLKAMEYDDFPWAVCCSGPREAEVMCRAAEIGGHLRIGFENNRRLPDGRSAASNGELVQEELRLIAQSDAADRPIASADWIRKHVVTQLP
jgi:uncharacterized protein (DUF849 family)